MAVQPVLERKLLKLNNIIWFQTRIKIYDFDKFDSCKLSKH